MDKITEALQNLGLKPEDIETVRSAFNEAVELRVKAETDLVSEKAEEYIAKQIDEGKAAYEKELDALNEKYLAIKTNTIAKNAEIALNEQTSKIEEGCQAYIDEFFEKAFAERYEKELGMMEESILDQLDKYLDYAITENISPDLIKTTAVNETFAPIIKGIQNLFEEQYVPLNLTGKKKIKEAETHVAELENSLKKQIDENMKLTDKTEKYAKRALLAEKTVGLSADDAANVRKFFAEKSFATTKSDIDSYCSMLKESAKRVQEAKERAVEENRVQMREHRSLVAENARAQRRPFSRSYIEDDTHDFVNEKLQARKANRLDENNEDAYLTSVAHYCKV